MKKIKFIFIIVCVILFAIVITNIKVFKVSGNSMEKTLYDGEYVIVLKNAKPKDGNIVVCDTTEIYLDEQYIIKRYFEDYSKTGLYLVGDNVDNSNDSRHFGELPYYSCQGVAVLKVSLKNGFGFLSN